MEAQARELAAGDGGKGQILDSLKGEANGCEYEGKRQGHERSQIFDLNN